MNKMELLIWIQTILVGVNTMVLLLIVPAGFKAVIKNEKSY